MPIDPKRLSDGFVDLSGGMDSGKSPSLASAVNPSGLLRNQLAYAVNATVRGGKIKPRPGFTQHTLNLDQVEDYPTDRFQGAAFYDSGNKAVLVASIGGRLFQYDVLNQDRVTELTIAGDENPSNVEQAFFLQAENYLIVQDGLSKPIIYNGSSTRRSKFEEKEIPTGTIMAYGLGRIVVCLPDGNSFRIGDLFGSTGVTLQDFRAAVLKFSQNDFLNEGGDFTARIFGAPSNYGPITAMQFVATMDSSLGQGPLQVFTTHSVFSVQLPFNRDAWKNLNNPIQTVSLISNGALSANSTQLVNSDVFFRSQDGLRSFIMARRDFGQWGNTPISKEVSRVLDFDSKFLLKFSSAVNFDNRYLTTCSPVATNYGTYHRGLIALDFDLVSSMGAKYPPAYDGVWIGPKILQLVKGTFNNVERCFAFTLESDNTVGLCEITRTEKQDNATTAITWYFETPCYNFNDSFNLKRLDTGDMWIDKLSGQCDFSLQFRPDRYPGWRTWQSWAECAKAKDCTTNTTQPCSNFLTFQDQFRPHMQFKKPNEDCDGLTKRPFVDGYEFQVRFQVTGYCEITQFRIHAFERAEQPYGSCLTSSPECKTLTACPGADFL